MIAIDTNILVHAHRADSPFHDEAIAALASLGRRRWAIPWPCLHEFLAIVTHPKIFHPPSPMTDALAAVEGWISAPGVVLLAEIEGYGQTLAEVLGRAKVVGPKVHDARVVALCLQHAVSELWTADRDFSRFRGLAMRNPLHS
ncbi:MAG TPA: TA system VapC family ribonuclease toxin [Terriglobales bacterium]|nr:TA system VapC family ribonuclease toxin [Terriglobales bacterium]